jgi:hypothetical protein
MSAPHLKLWKFKERRGAQTSKYGSAWLKIMRYIKNNVALCHYAKWLKIMRRSRPEAKQMKPRLHCGCHFVHCELVVELCLMVGKIYY